MSHSARIVSTSTDYAHRINAGAHELVADEPPALGGRDADDKLHVHRTLWASGALDDAQWARLLEVAAKTPVTKVMREGAVITSARGH